VRPVHDNYFVQLDAAPATAQAATRARLRDEAPAPRRRRRRRKPRQWFLLLLAVALGAWFVWAVQQPGGVSGVLNGWVDNVRGDVQDVASGPALSNAARYFNQQYERTGSYPQPTEEQLTAAGIGIDVNMVYCGPSAVVLRTITVSRLLVAGEDRGDVGGRQGCPADLANPAPWKAK
jgi:hypothetical protein